MDDAKLLTILHAEDDRLVASTVMETLEAEGWKVETYADGNAVLNRLAGQADFDLLLLDNGLPNVSGLDIARYARSLTRYRKTPIIMLSADRLRDDARAGGVNLFLRKPEDVKLLVDAVRLLLRLRG